MHNIFSYIVTPVVSAFIGWITTYLAIKMIFRPRRPIPLFGGFVLQGLIPRRQADLAKSIAAVVEQELVSHRDVTATLSSPEIQDDLISAVDKQIDIFLKEKLGGNPMIAMFLQGDMLLSIKAGLTEQLKSVMPEILGGLVTKLESKLNFQDIVRDRVQSFDLFKLEEIIYGIASRELRAIEYLCGLLGFVIGVVQVAFSFALA